MMTAPVFTATFLLLMFSTAKPDISADNKAALLALRDALGGATRSWGTPAHLDACSWEGITCDPQRNTVLEIRLPGSQLSGRLPPNAIGNLTGLRVLSLRQNFVSGQIPPDVASCEQLRVLNLHDNRLSGQLPAILFDNLTRLLRLNLALNQFSGGFPTGIGNLTGLRTLYLEGNQFTGTIPDLPPLLGFNVSGNRLTGSIPTAVQNMPETAFYGNSLCGKPLPPCPAVAAYENDGAASMLSKYGVPGLVVGAVVCLLLIVVIACIVRRKSGRGRKAATVGTVPDGRKGAESTDSSVSSTGGAGRRRIPGGGDSDGLVFTGSGDKLFDIMSLLEAPAEVLGKGPFGTTYKACLEGSRQVVVLKRLRYGSVSEREFKEKVERLGATLHVNLCPLIAYFYGKDEKLLIFDYAPMGSLYALLHGREDGGERVAVTWEMRSAIAIAAARGIEHLHATGLPHGNIKSSNVLLSNHPAARISEFGIAQIVTPDGYLDTPDGGISEKADVYHFGVLLLELLTRRNPTEDETYLPGWVQSVDTERWFTDVIDPELARDLGGKEQPIEGLLVLALSCACAGFPERRPAMSEVRRQIEALWHVG